MGGIFDIGVDVGVWGGNYEYSFISDKSLLWKKVYNTTKI